MFLELFWNIRKVENYQMQTGKEFIRTLLKGLSSLGLRLISLQQMYRHTETNSILEQRFPTARNVPIGTFTSYL